ncbi:hypothetical protein [Chryseobacterium cucumeris]|uniref:hypothetical protein n=1 Tax=Chryseobacterium cucumeris TaxID=1813611 RepID=UPI001F4B7921|nr:hypothetical protein [Chryseobacterium cucumeris]
MYRFIEPEVAGGLGEQSQLDNSFLPPLIKNLHYEFEGWLGNDLVESSMLYSNREIEKRYRI